ncbi:hypothetical protein [Bosea sp. 117]|uniref:hypothetical protein n=1 Tax=Bosea sp. 117 TaxID=1125973 RepID=UPI000494A6EB|nr:hypothetical protein [Bosea sp. 117]
MRRPLSALLVALSLLAAAPAVADPVFPGDGTVGMTPPPGMGESPAVRGFEDREAKASILIVEMPAAAYGQITAGLTNESLAEKGVTIEKRRDVTLSDGSKGLLLAGFQTVGAGAIKKWIFVAGGKQSTGLVTAQMPEEASARYSDAAIEKSLESVVFRAPPSNEELLAKLPFRVTEAEGYRVLKVLGSTALMMTKGPSDVIEGTDQPYFIVILAPGEVRDDERESIAKRAISSVPGVREMKIERGGPLRVGGQPGFELIANGTDLKTGKPMKVAQWLRFGRTSFVRIVGVVPADAFDSHFAELRAMRDGVEMR